MGPRRSTRLNVTISGAAPPPRVSTTGTTAVATLVATHGKVHCAFTTAQAVPSKATAQTSLSHASRTEQPALVPTCSHKAAFFRQAACFRGLPSSPSQPKTISTNHQAWGIFTIFLHRFDISQLKSRAEAYHPSTTQ
ncbi:hypothetical protein ACFX1Q_008422 [Malus domestica]